MVGPTLIVHGTEEQKKEHLPRDPLAARSQWCQGFSEPGSGSDLASLQTRAVRDGDDYVINGQKIWTSGAHYADWMFMLARTDPDAPKHRGISYFLLDMKTPGVTVRPLINMAERPRLQRGVLRRRARARRATCVGEENRGWYVGDDDARLRALEHRQRGRRPQAARAAGEVRERARGQRRARRSRACVADEAGGPLRSRRASRAAVVSRRHDAGEGR